MSVRSGTLSGMSSLEESEARLQRSAFPESTVIINGPLCPERAKAPGRPLAFTSEKKRPPSATKPTFSRGQALGTPDSNGLHAGSDNHA